MTPERLKQIRDGGVSPITHECLDAIEQLQKERDELHKKYTDAFSKAACAIIERDELKKELAELKMAVLELMTSGVNVEDSRVTIRRGAWEKLRAWRPSGS